MPQKSQGIAFKRFFSRLSIHEGVIAGIGVLLFFLGLWSNSLLTKIFCFAIAGVAAYYIVDAFRAISDQEAEEEEGAPEDEEREATRPEPIAPFRVDEERREPTETEPEPFVPLSAEEPPAAGRTVQFDEPAERREEIRTYSRVDFVDDVPGTTAGGQLETKTEFNFLLQKVLAVVKEVLFAHTVAFYWINRESRQLVLESKLSESEAFSGSRKLPLGIDIASRVALSGVPEVVAQIATGAERDIVPYYTSLQEIRSFVSVPVFYPMAEDGGLPVAVLAVDSKAEDAYGPESILLLAKFTKMLSALLRSSTEKYDLVSDSGVLSAEHRFHGRAFGASEISEIGNALAEEASGLVPWDALTLTLFDESQKQWVVANVRTRHNHRYVVAKQVIDFHSCIVGKAIRNNAAQHIPDLSKTSEARFLVNEASLGIARVGSFLAVPIASPGKSYGALALECREKSMYGAKEIAAISDLASMAGVALELREANDIIKEFVILDESTGTVSKKHLMECLSNELRRADDDGSDISFVLFAISSLADITARYGKAGADAAVARVAAILRSSIRSYDIIGRFDQSMFGVILVKTPSKDAYLWAEKLRSAIASAVISFEQKTFSVSVTVGICGATEGMTAEECVSAVSQVLEKAKQDGGNIVRVY
ncbi:MAG TPA: diguanylate cyclase [Bacteroidota bacterium]|nr:diguanylate cyclase [Bacteroidota bacterium]